MPGILQSYLIVVAILSLITFSTYGWDKYKAQNEGRRIPEKTLHLLALAFGWVGAIAGQQFFRHKTRKVTFLLITYLITALHVVLIILMIIYA